MAITTSSAAIITPMINNILLCESPSGVLAEGAIPVGGDWGGGVGLGWGVAALCCTGVPYGRMIVFDPSVLGEAFDGFCGFTCVPNVT